MPQQPTADALTLQGVAQALSPACRAALQLQVLAQASSTNVLLRQQAEAGAPAGTVLLAGAQTAGRGRLGRQFYSPQGSGIYLSLLLRPDQLPLAQAVRITTTAAVAVCRAIEQTGGGPAQIKWVNDVFVAGRKVCGILTESALDPAAGCLKYAVLGIGLNVCPPPGGFPPELAGIAGAVFDAPAPGLRCRLAAAVLEQVWACCSGGDDTLEEYRRRSLVPGHAVNVLSPVGQRRALALGIDDDCRLLVQYADGSREALSSGEISVRLAGGDTRADAPAR